MAPLKGNPITSAVGIDKERWHSHSPGRISRFQIQTTDPGGVGLQMAGRQPYVVARLMDVDPSGSWGTLWTWLTVFTTPYIPTGEERNQVGPLCVGKAGVEGGARALPLSCAPWGLHLPKDSAWHVPTWHHGHLCPTPQRCPMGTGDPGHQEPIFAQRFPLSYQSSFPF